MNKIKRTPIKGAPLNANHVPPMKRKASIIMPIIFILLLSVPAEAATLNPERFYQEIWCGERKGIIEHILPDKTRVDCLLDDYAVEVEFASKYSEALGQSIFYGAMTGLKPGIFLIMENPEKDYKHLIRLLIGSQNIDGIRIWVFW